MAHLSWQTESKKEGNSSFCLFVLLRHSKDWMTTTHVTDSNNMGVRGTDPPCNQNGYITFDCPKT